MRCFSGVLNCLSHHKQAQCPCDLSYKKFILGMRSALACAISYPSINLAYELYRDIAASNMYDTSRVNPSFESKNRIHQCLAPSFTVHLPNKIMVHDFCMQWHNAKCLMFKCSCCASVVLHDTTLQCNPFLQLKGNVPF